jgi:hypothetical protein
MTTLPRTKCAPPAMARRKFRNDDFDNNLNRLTRAIERRDYTRDVGRFQAAGARACPTMIIR